MKKTFFTAACLLALVACAIVSACRKDDVETIKESPVTPQTNPRTWPNGALESGDDTYDYGDVKYYPEQDTTMIKRRDLDRIETMLNVYFNTEANINDLLPSGFSPVLPMNFNWYVPGTKGSIVVFSGMDRKKAIQQLKAINEVFAIEPVYNWRNRQEAAIPLVQVILLNPKEDANLLFNIADSLHLVFTRTTPAFGPMGSITELYEFIADHSLVNSVVAANIIYETLGTDHVYQSISGYDVCSNTVNE